MPQHEDDHLEAAYEERYEIEDPDYDYESNDLDYELTDEELQDELDAQAEYERDLDLDEQDDFEDCPDDSGNYGQYM